MLKKTVVIATIAILMSMTRTTALALEWDNPYTDVPSYANEWIKWVTENDIISGTSSTAFSPNAPISRAQFVNMLYRYEKPSNEKNVENFTDVQSDSPYFLNIAWAKQHTIVKGIGGNLFAPDETINAEQAATILYRYIQYKEKSSLFTLELQFDNESSISAWALEAYKKICKRAGISGVFLTAPGEGGSFASASPHNRISRINAVLFLFSIDEIIK